MSQVLSERKQNVMASAPRKRNKSSPKAKKKITNDDEIPSKKAKISVDNDELQQDSPTATMLKGKPITQFKYDLRKVLINSNHNIKKWLNLRDVPECLRDFARCVSIHGRKADVSEHHDAHVNGIVDMFMRDGNYLRACDYLDHSVIDRMKIPNAKAMSHTFQLMLNIDNSVDEPDAKCYTLRILEECFYNLVSAHPPHAWYMKQYYLDLLTRTIPQCKHTDHHYCESYSGIFLYCINLLERELTGKSPEEPIIPNKGKMTPKHKKKITLEMEDDITRCNYDYLNREERISRLFILLRMFVHLFEQDLAFRIIVYNKEENHKRKLIISNIIWKNTDILNVGCMTSYIRKIINLFIISIRTERTKSDCNTLGRLLGAIAHGMQTSTENRKRLFSNITNQLNTLAIEISISLQSEAPSVVNKAIPFFQPCLLKYLVCRSLLSVILSNKNKCVNDMTLHEILRKKLWNQFPSDETVAKYQKKNSQKEEAMLFTKQVSVIDCIAIIHGAVVGFIDVFDLRMIDQNNVLSITSLFNGREFENKISKRVTRRTENDKVPSDSDDSPELITFRREYEKHFKIKPINTPSIDNLISSESSFECIMIAHHSSLIPYMINEFSYIPIISWVTGRNYYMKCKMYLEMVKLIQELKDENPDLFKNFGV